MVALVRFLLKDYFRSSNYFAPFLLFAVFIVAQYSYTTDRMVDTYSMTALYLYAISGWITFTVFAAEDGTQQIITSLNAKSPAHYFLAKLTVALVAVALLSLFSIVYPLATQRIVGPKPFVWIVCSFLVHLLLGALALVVGALFNPLLVRSKSVSLGGMLLVLLLFLAHEEVVKQLSLPNALSDLLPPLPRLMNALQKDVPDVQGILQSGLWIFLCGCLLAGVYLLLMKANSGLAGQNSGTELQDGETRMNRQS
ncbi:hypothetical protein [Paenibacillus glufosinatiresistens]|uniref:hypothetical protein n=1 Tax=Paenibacillus glufosinatiresistens TaxID=3070657 RepID=UPI00286E0770|nr:hypothetical protein [Paenibacillus sp. YX.27]